MSGLPLGVGPSTAERSAGRTGRRRALPTSRAVAGGFVVALAAVLAFSGWLTTHHSTGREWVVAGRALPAGIRLSATDLTTTSLRLGDGAVAEGAFPGTAALVGRTLAVAVAPGALITRSEVRATGPAGNLRPVPVTVAPADLVDLEAGDLVDVLETSASSPGSRTVVVVRGARVESTSQPSSGLLGSNGEDVITLGVSDLAEVEAVVAAEHIGTVDLIVGEPGDGTGQGGAPSDGPG